MTFKKDTRTFINEIWSSNSFKLFIRQIRVDLRNRNNLFINDAGLGITLEGDAALNGFIQNPWS